MAVVIPLVIAVGLVAWMLRPRRDAARPQRLAILAAALPPSVLALAAVAFQLGQNASGDVSVSDVANNLFIAGLAVIAAALLALAGAALARRGELARGLGFGVCLAVMVAVIEVGLLGWLGGV